MISKCVKCENTSFEMKENSPIGSRFKLLFVQCYSCGTPIGAMEYFNSGSQIEIVTKKIQNLENKLDNIESLIRQRR